MHLSSSIDLRGELFNSPTISDENDSIIITSVDETNKLNSIAIQVSINGMQSSSEYATQ